MIPTITAFERLPDGSRSLARDTRVRWAVEEVGQPYEVRLVSFKAMKEPAHLALNPFGQIPTYEEGDLALFETGAIVLYVAEHHAGFAQGFHEKGVEGELIVWNRCARRISLVHSNAWNPRVRSGTRSGLADGSISLRSA